MSYFPSPVGIYAFPQAGWTPLQRLVGPIRSLADLDRETRVNQIVTDNLASRNGHGEGRNAKNRAAQIELRSELSMQAETHPDLTPEEIEAIMRDAGENSTL